MAYSSFIARMSGHSAGENSGGSENPTRTASDSIPTSSSTRKRHSGQSSEAGRVHDEGSSSGLSESKVRKYARNSTCTPSTSNVSVRATGSSASSTISPTSSGTKKNSELRFLTDYFPEQDVEAGPLTRSRLRTRTADSKRPSTSTAEASSSKRSKSGIKKPKRTATAVATDLSVDSSQHRSPTPDPSSSNLTVAGSEVSGFSFASSFASELSQSVTTSVDSADLRTLGANSPATANFGLLNAMPTTSRDNDAANSSASANSPFLVRSQHVHQRASQFLTGLVPRMQQLLGTSSAVSSATMSSNVGFSSGSSAEYLPQMRIMSLMDELRSDNEIRQSEACSELSDMLLLGNEESLPNFPIRELILCLISLLNKDHNFELMLSASRCITNLQEALPRSYSFLVEAVPVAEQSLFILEVISRRNAKNILTASGVQAVISHVDFFSLPTQRLAFQIAANCASFVTPSEFHLAQDCLADLTQRLNMDDKRCVESICSFFNRLIENMRFHPHRLRQIAGKNHELLRVFQQLLSIQPLTISSGTFISLLKSLRYMSTSCGDLSVALFEMGFGRTLRFLLVGSEKKAEQQSIEATNRPAQQLREIVDLIGELLPKLPSTGMFEVNVYLEQYTNPSVFIQNGRHKQSGTMMWVYKDPATSGRLVEWKLFAPNEQLALERNRTMGVTLMSLEVEGQLCEIDFSTMTRRVIATGAEVEIDRRPYNDYGENKDEREKLRNSSVESFLDFIATVFPLLVEIGSSSTCVNLRYDCVRVMLRMLYAVEDKDKLLSFLHEIPLAAYISSTLSSSKNLALVALAIQLVGALLEKLPDLYMPLFEAEGVFFELKRRSVMAPTRKSNSKSSHSSSPPGSRTKPSEKHHRRAVEHNIDTAGLDAPAAAALGRLLQQQSASTQISNSQSSVSSDIQLPPISTTTATVNPNVSPAVMRYAQQTPQFPINSRSVLPNLFLSVGSLQGSLYQTLSNAVGASYSHPVYGLNYAGAFSAPIDSSSSNFSTTHMSPMNTASISSVKANATERLEKFIQIESSALSAKCVAGTGVNTKNLENMNLLVEVANLLSETGIDAGIKPLHNLRDALSSRELSAFQVNYSGIIGALIGYLTENEGRLLPGRSERLRRFASVFMLLNSYNRPIGGDEAFESFNQLVSRIVLAVERLEQFSVRITNLSGNLSSLSGASMSSSGGSGGSQNVFGSTTYLRGAQALRFFQSHQIRCNLRRHPSCKFLREWRRGRGSIKVDPFTAISAIERYLTDRGIGTTSQDWSSENEEVSDEDKEIGSGSPNASFKGRIEILIGDNRLPSDMSILQAIRQYSLPQEDEDQETIPPSIWIAGHTLYYRAVVDDDHSQAPCSSGLSASNKSVGTSKATASSSTIDPTIGIASSMELLASSRKTRSRSKKLLPKEKIVVEKRSKDDRNKDKLFFNEGKMPQKHSLLDGYLRNTFDQTIDDPSERGLVLLRILYGLNTYWWYLFEDNQRLPSTHKPILSQSCFHSFKLNSKVSRQLSDFLTVATQQIPRWTKNLVRSVPFAFPFTTRRNFLYCTAFGRDRALMHLVNEANPDDHDNESNSRLVPRLERRKISINRNTLLKDAQQAMNQLASSRPALEIVFDGEVGTGFGPTLEFYSTLSRELQKHSIRLWHGSPVVHKEEGEAIEYTNGENGLYPVITRHPSNSRAWDSRSRRFEFIGRVMAQTLLDSRIMDVPFATPFFKWLLGQQDSLGVADFEALEPTIYNSLREIGSMKAEEFEDLEMYFTYPGNDVFELVKGGKHKLLNLNNYHHFVELIVHWRLVEGVRADMESVRRGFQLVVHPDHLAIFEANEMEGLFCGCSESADDSNWTRSILQQSIRPDHGYTHESIQIGWLVDMLISFNREDRRKFLQFVTGSPRLPVGGFRALHPPLTVVRKVATYGCADIELPSAMTCYNYVKIPPYQDYETFVRQFRVALEHCYSFHLT
ncbi:Thyroid hormone receptor interactor 12 [Aphelenchoides besseyi]|nr:Thyroid hormone receptor interactor 12 [Aphelenchoides besseyi]KAI6209653.1 Thyroid hormone receptor interactor 12 [Aphelenchoides besseyi]